MKLILYFLVLLALGSCVQLRYTDYGRPFDFLKAKNQYVHQSKGDLDTANVAIFNGETPILKKETILVKDTLFEPIKMTKDSLSITATHDLLFETGSSSELLPIEDLAENQEMPLKKHVLNYATGKSIAERQDGPWPEWWSNMWSAIWRFFLKWFLIAVLFLAVVIGLVIGITALVTWLGGPIAGAITLFVLLMVLLFVFGIDLSWLF